MSASRGNKTGREKASKTNHIQNGKTELAQIGSKNQASNLGWVLWIVYYELMIDWTVSYWR